MNEKWLRIPAELRALRQWAVSTLTVDPVTGKQDKSPRNPHTMERISVTDPSGWATFEECINSGAAAIGFILSAGDPFVVIDLDPPTSPEHEAVQARIREHFVTYSEKSVSGKGTHLWLRGYVGRGRHRDGVELYDRERFIICTGDVANDLPIVELPEMLGELLRELPEGISADEVEDENARHDDRVIVNALGEALTRPHPPGSDKSREDYSLMCRIVWWTRNKEQAERLFVDSGYYRPEKGPKYVGYSLAKAITEFRADHPYATPIFIEHGRKLVEGSRSIQRKLNRLKRSKGFDLVLAGEMAFSEPQYLIEELFEAGELVVMFGPPGAGKSFIAIDMAACIATGTPFHGLAVETGTVVYIAGEGHAGLARRRRAWELQHKVELGKSPMYFSTISASLLDPDSIEKVITKIEDLGTVPSFLVIDTLNRNMGPGDENSTKDMTAFIAAVEELQDRFGCTVLIVHHTGHGDQTRARGSSVLKGAADVELRVEKNKNVFKMTNSKHKDGPDGGEYSYTAVEQLIITTAAGKRVTSLALTTGALPTDQMRENTANVLSAEIDKAFLKMVAWHNANKVRLSHKGGKNFAPTMFEAFDLEQPVKLGFKAAGYKLAMERLEKAGLIIIENKDTGGPYDILMAPPNAPQTPFERQLASSERHLNAPETPPERPRNDE